MEVATIAVIPKLPEVCCEQEGKGSTNKIQQEHEALRGCGLLNILKEKLRNQTCWYSSVVNLWRIFRSIPNALI